LVSNALEITRPWSESYLCQNRTITKWYNGRYITAYNAVGVTPENKYWLYVDKEDHLIKQWAYYQNFKDSEPKFLKPWNNYQKTGDILLSLRPNENVGQKM
jgi:hypothetical protein